MGDVVVEAHVLGTEFTVATLVTGTVVEAFTALDAVTAVDTG